MRRSGYHRHPLPPELVAALAAVVLTLDGVFRSGVLAVLLVGLAG